MASATARTGTTGKPRLTGRKPMPQPKVRHASDKITVMLTKPSRTITLGTRETLRDEEPKPAKRIADEPGMGFMTGPRDESAATRLRARADELAPPAAEKG